MSARQFVSHTSCILLARHHCREHGSCESTMWMTVMPRKRAFNGNTGSRITALALTATALARRQASPVSSRAIPWSDTVPAPNYFPGSILSSKRTHLLFHRFSVSTSLLVTNAEANETLDSLRESCRVECQTSSEHGLKINGQVVGQECHFEQRSADELKGSHWNNGMGLLRLVTLTPLC